MASISALGVGSNLGLSNLLDQLSASEQERLTPITAQQTANKAKLTSFGIVKSALEKVQTAAAALQKADSIAKTSVTSTNTAFTATIDSTAATGSYTIAVTQLAKSQSLLSQKVASSSDKIGATTDGTGSRTLTITQDSQKKPLTVTLTDDQTSLTGIRDAINKQQGNVNASIIKGDDNSYYLSLTSRDTGVSSAMSISVTGDDALQGIMGFNGDATDTSNGMTQKVAAKDAQLTVNNVAISRSSNTITDAPNGVTLNLKAETKADAPEQLTIGKDSTATVTAIKAWVDAYNSLQTTIASQTTYTAVDKGSDDQSSSNGALLGDGTLRTIQTQLRSQLSNVQAVSDYGTLASLGITQDIKGKLQIDTTKLNKALDEKPASVTEFFAGDGKETGFATQYNTLLTKMLDTDKGAIVSATNGINSTIKKLTDQSAAVTTSITANIARYKAQFTQLDTLMSKLNNTATYLTQQFNALSS
ncbi:flagellar filament capping protein FliD [Edaphovirga cremea]|uniref:flagellar filament capping protein FliD n=1 Tax=Edaphovirga cremea TaxID=2267246 RepID=UPI000DEEC426|nr:flagellar filament capping protein FliD [Edaphovirga cremea]